MRITNVQNENGLITLKVEGRLCGAFADELRREFDHTREQGLSRLTVDLTSVTFIDDAGKQVLKQICECGADFVASGCHTRGVIDEITRCRQSVVPPRAV